MKKRIIIIPIIILIILSFSIFFLIKYLSISENKSPIENTPEIESLVTYNQRELFISDGVTIESPQDHKVYIYMDSALIINVKEKHIKSFKITNFKGNSRVGKMILIAPTEENVTDCRSHIFTSCEKEIIDSDIIDAGKEINYVVTENPQKYNEVKNWFQLTPKFAIMLKDIGSVNYEKKMEAEGYFDSNKYIEYLDIPNEDLTASIQFDIEIEFDDNTKYVKRFYSNIEGSKVKDDPYYTVRLNINK